MGPVFRKHADNKRMNSQICESQVNHFAVIKKQGDSPRARLAVPCRKQKQASPRAQAQARTTAEPSPRRTCHPSLMKRTPDGLRQLRVRFLVRTLWLSALSCSYAFTLALSLPPCCLTGCSEYLLKCQEYQRIAG